VKFKEVLATSSSIIIITTHMIVILLAVKSLESLKLLLNDV
jgi:hypothetical protein